MGRPSSKTPVTVMLSIGGCTNTNVGALVTFWVEAVTWTTPVPPGVQVVKAASQRPAQPAPLGAIFKIEVSLDANVKVPATLLPAAFCADAMKLMKLPSWTEVLLPGVRFTRAGNDDWPAGGCPPQPMPH